MLVLLWGLQTDSPLAAVKRELDELGIPALFVHQRDPQDIDARITVGDLVDAAVRVDGRWVDLASVTAAYLRPFDSCRLPQILEAGPESAAWKHAVSLDDILLTWAALTEALLVNPLHAMSPNNSKPYQLEQLRNIGWSVPDTLITTDPLAARDFWEQHGEVVYKSISGVRSKVSRLRPEHLDRLPSISSCPTQLQQHIEGADVRVHVAGEQVFACEMRSEADDYRYPAGPVDVFPCALPFDVEDRCRKTAADLQLPFVGIDLRRTRYGEWFCFEANPSPGFTYYENTAGLPIGRAVAELLAGGQATHA
jgi:hypothetical protein